MTGVTTDANGKLVLEELDLDFLNDLLSEQNERGRYSRVIKNHIASGNIYTIVSALPEFAKTEQSAIVQSLKLNLKEKFADSNCKVAKKDEHTLLINTAALAAAQQAALEAANADTNADAQ